MDELVAQSPEQQIITSAPVTSAIPTTDDNDVGIISNGQSKINTNVEPKEIILPSAISTMTSTTPLDLQTDNPLELFICPTFCETLAISPAETPYAPTSALIPSVLKQGKHVDTEIEVKEPGQQSAVDQQHSTKDLSTFSKNLEQVSKPASLTISTSIVPIDEKPVKNTREDGSDFVFYKCRFCGLTYNYLTTLRAHERVHNIDEPYKCNRCSESFHYMCELDYHAKQHSDLKGYKCECGRTFHSYTDLLYHKHPGDEDKESITTTAPIAAKSAPPIPESDFPIPKFIEEGFEPKHPLKVYSDVRLNPYICQYCSKSYPNSRMLTYHMYGHRGEKIFNPRVSRYLMARAENSYISPRS
ncbi:C2H2-type zinc finger family protein [Brugia pahangi]